MKPQPANGVRDEGAFPAGLNAPLITGVIPMDTLLGILRRGTMSGSVAGGAAALTAAVRAPLDCSTAYAPINAVTHCIWPRRAFAETGPSARFTLTGLAIHQASAIFWGLLFETCVERAAGLRDRVGERSTGMQAATAIAAAGATLPSRMRSIITWCPSASHRVSMRIYPIAPCSACIPRWRRDSLPRR
jgi:hypothetical protein